MPTMFSGAHVTAAKQGVPTLLDIGLSLSRLTRFAGQGSRWFSVLDHSFFVEQLAIEDGYEQEPGPRLACLLHDAHEAVTADVPSDIKSDVLHEFQRTLDTRIMDAYFPGGIEAYEFLHGFVKDLDMRALVTEAFLIGPPVFRHFAPAMWKRRFGHEKPTNRDITTLDRLLRSERLSCSGILWQNEDAPNVRDYVRGCESHADELRLRQNGKTA